MSPFDIFSVAVIKDLIGLIIRCEKTKAVTEIINTLNRRIAME
jgi:hypothetical protein